MSSNKTNEIIDYISHEFNVNFNSNVPFYEFERETFAEYYASLVNSLSPIPLNEIHIMNRGDNGQYLLNINSDFEHTLCVSGFDTKKRVFENVEYIKNLIISEDKKMLPEFVPSSPVPATVGEPYSIKVLDYLARTQTEYKDTLFDPNMDLVYNFTPNSQNLQRELTM